MATDASFFLRRDTGMNTWSPQFIADPGVDALFYLVNGTGLFAAMNLPIAATFGGTGFDSYAVGDLLYASTTTALSKLADIATGNALISGGVGVAPSWGKIGLTTHVSGILPAPNGGTGQSSYAVGDLLYANTTTTLAKLADTATGNALLSGGIGVAPAWGKVTPSHFSGVLPVANGGTGLSTVASGKLLYASALDTLAELSIGTSLVLSTGTLTTIQGIRTADSPTFAGLTLTAALGVTSGGTGLSAAALGDTLYGSASNVLSRLTGNITTTRKFFRQVGDGANSAAPAWDTLVAGDIPDLSSIYQPLSSKLTAFAALANAAGVLTNNGSGVYSWAAASTGTVTSVALSVPAFLSVSGSPVTTSGTLAVTLSGTALPVANGGTGLTTIASGKLIYASALDTFAALSLGNSLVITTGTLDTIQDVRTSATPQWDSVIASSTVPRITYIKTDASTGLKTWRAGIVGGQWVLSSRSDDDSSTLLDLLTVAKTTGSLTATGNIFSSGDFRATSGLPAFALYNSGNGTDLKLWKIWINGGTLQIVTLNDSDSSVLSTPLSIDRSSSLATFAGAITTGSPSGGSAAAWRLGTYGSGLVRVEVAGIGYDLAASGQDLRTSATPQFTRLGVGMAADATRAFSVTGGGYISGSVGIGTTSPGYKLEVAGTLGTFANAGFITSESTGADGNQAGIQAVGPGNANWLIITNKSSLTGAADALGFYKNAGATGLKLAVTDAGLIQGKRFVPTAGTPTATAKGASGTGPTISVTGTDSGFRLSVTVGTSPNANDDIAWIDFSTAFSAAPFVAFAQNTNQSATVYTSGTTTARIFFSVLGTLTAGVTYKWDFIVVGA